MRWPFGLPRRVASAIRRDPVAGPGGTGGQRVAGPAPGGTRAWLSVPPPSTVACAPAPVLHDASRLPYEPGNWLGRAAPRRAGGQAPAGRVSGLVTPRPHRDAGLPALRHPGGWPAGSRGQRAGQDGDADQADPGGLPDPPVRHRTLAARERQAPGPGSLTTVTEDSVGEPRASDPPFRASAFERQISLVKERPPWQMGSQIPAMDDTAVQRPAVAPMVGARPGYRAATLRGGPPPLVQPASPVPPGGQPAGMTPPAPASPVAEQSQPLIMPPAPAGPGGSRSRRRANLGESRRLGLGRPRGTPPIDAEPAEPPTSGPEPDAPAGADQAGPGPAGTAPASPVPPSAASADISAASPASEPVRPAAHGAEPASRATAGDAGTLPRGPQPAASPGSPVPPGPVPPALARSAPGQSGTQSPGRPLTHPGPGPAAHPSTASRPGANGDPPATPDAPPPGTAPLTPRLAGPGQPPASPPAGGTAPAADTTTPPGGAPAEPPTSPPATPHPDGHAAPPGQDTAPPGRGTAHPAGDTASPPPGMVRLHPGPGVSDQSGPEPYIRIPLEPAPHRRLGLGAPIPRVPASSQPAPSEPAHSGRIPGPPAASGPEPPALVHPAEPRAAAPAGSGGPAVPGVPASTPTAAGTPAGLGPEPPVQAWPQVPPGGGGPGAAVPQPLGGAVYRAPAPARPVLTRPAPSHAVPSQMAPAHPGPVRTAPARSGSYTQSVPQDLSGRFSALTGIDVTGIRVHRGPAVTQQARAYQARAFTRAGEIFLPEEAGPLDGSATGGLLAHELAHAVQQRILSPSLPDEGSPDGQELEREASQAERWYASGGSPPPRLAHLPVALLLASHAGHPGHPEHPGYGHTQQTWTAGSLPPQIAEWLDTVKEPAAGGVQRQPDEPASMPALPAPPPATPEPALAPAAGTAILPAASPPPTPVTETPAQSRQSEESEQLKELLANAPRLTELCAERPANLDDPVSLDELSTKLYQRLRGMLRGELLVDRERAGLLADIG